MTEQILSRTFYIAEDGKEFLDREACEEYEKNERLIEYFSIRHNPDLTETGNYCAKSYIAVRSERCCCFDAAFEWAIRKYNGYLGTGVMGYGFMPHFKLEKIDKKTYFESRLASCEFKIFLSEIPVEGFPKNYNYVKEWDLKGSR